MLSADRMVGDVPGVMLLADSVYRAAVFFQHTLS